MDLGQLKTAKKRRLENWNIAQTIQVKVRRKRNGKHRNEHKNYMRHGDKVIFR